MIFFNPIDLAKTLPRPSKAALGMLVLCSIVTSPTSAQKKEPTSDEVKKIIIEKLWDEIDTGPDGNLLGNKSWASIQAYQDSQTVNLNYVFSKRAHTPAIDSGDNILVTAFSLKASAPLRQDQDKTSLPTLDGLANSYSAQLAFSISSVPTREDFFATISNNDQAFAKAVPQMFVKALTDAKCGQRLPAYLAGNGPLRLRLAQEIVRNKKRQMSDEDLDGYNETADVDDLRNELGNTETMSALITKYYSDAEANGDPTIDFAPYVSADLAILEACAPEFYKDYIAESWEQAPGFTWSISGKAQIGAEEFDYFDPTSFEGLSDTKTPFALGLTGSASKASKRGSQVFNASFEYQRTYVLPEDMTMCRTEAGATEEVCQSGPFGPPVRQNQLLASAEYRSRLENIFNDNPIAFSVKATYDAEQDVFGVEAPIYLFSFAGADLDAGIRVGWRSDTDEADVGFFFGKTF